MSRSEDRLAVARALGAALVPIIDLCLTVGLTSPELEGVLRTVFVKRAMVKLPSLRRSGKPASDVRVGLAVGLHRNEVRRIRSAKEELTMERRQRRRRTERLVTGWSGDPRYINSGGHPLDLPLLGRERGPSFQELASKYLPGVSPGSAIRELRRQALVQVLPDDVIRLRASAPRTAGFTPSNVAQVGNRLQRLASTIVHNMTESDGQFLFKEINNLIIDSEMMPLMRRTLERRTQVFLEGIEKELRTQSGAKRKKRSPTRLGISVLSWEDE
jgi:hypothetical protein